MNMILSVHYYSGYRAPALYLTYGCLAGEHRGGQRTGRSPIQLSGLFDKVRSFLQQAAGYSDMVNAQEPATSEGQVPATA